jgi:hypothetical protein
MKKTAITLLALSTLAGCEPQSADNLETQQRIAVCEDVMRVYMTQGKVYERDRKRLVGSCQIAQSKRTLEQWQCALKAMQGGEPFKSASDKCGGAAVDTP